MVSQLSLITAATTVFYIITGLLGIGLVIGIHEFGHFFFAKLFKINVPSFSLGFGPAIFEKKISGTVFKVSAIPCGGYVEVAGMAEVGQGDQAQASRKDEYSFASKPYYQQLCVMFGGILFNLLSAYLALILLFALGVPKSPMLFPLNSTTTIESIQPETPAAKAGLQPGDTITKFNNESVDPLKLLERIRENSVRPPKTNSGKEVTLTLLRQGSEITVPVTLEHPQDKAPTRGRLGVQFALKDLEAKEFGGSIKAGIAATNQLIKATYRGFVSLFKSRSTAGVGGPIMIINQITQGAQQGFKVWLLLLVLISINLAILNLIPLPILDGGQILFYTLEALFRRPLPEKIRLGIHYASWILMMILVVYLSFKDLKVLLNGFWKK